MMISSKHEHYFLERDWQFHIVEYFLQWDCRSHFRTLAWHKIVHRECRPVAEQPCWPITGPDLRLSYPSNPAGAYGES